MKYARRKDATQYTPAGELKCDRCGNVVKPWMLVRPDNCGPSPAGCIRAFAPVLAGWEAEKARKAANAPKVHKVFQRYTSEERADRAASFRMGYRQRQAVGEVFWTHDDVPGIAFPTRKAALDAAARLKASATVAA